MLKNSVADLKEAVIGMAGDRRDQAVVIRGDARAPYQAMITAMDALGQLGFTRIQLATTPEAKKQ